MNRERALKILLVLVGLLFSAGIYPLTVSLWKMKQADYGDDMMLSLYFALGIFLLMAVRNPSANRSLIAFAAWSSFAHGAVMAVLAFQIPNERRDLLIAVAVLAFIGVALIAWLRQSRQASAYRQPVRRLALWGNRPHPELDQIPRRARPLW